jgi:CheY-like chemotaxis protein
MPYVLIVEDDPGDVKKSRGFLEQVQPQHEIRVATSATAALRQLNQAIANEAELPEFVVLDLELEHESGFEVLRFWKTNDVFGRIPILVWTILDEPEIQICKYFGVQAVVRKQDGMKAFAEGIKVLGRAGGAAS